MVKKAQARPKKSAAAGRVRPLTKKQAKLKSRKDAGKQPPIPTSFTLLKESYGLIKKHWKVAGGIVLVYFILNAVFAGGLFGDFSNAISTARQTHHFSDALGGYGSLLGGSAAGSQTGSVAPSILLALESLVIIWALRQLLAGKKIAVKQAYYQSMAPLIPFLLVVLVILLQLLPCVAGAAVLAVVGASVSSGPVTFISALIFIALSAWTIYMISGSIFAIYIVTLPDMQPRQALRSAKKLVRFRRWTLLRRLFFLPLFIFLVLGVITVPLILVLPFLVSLVFFVLLMLSVFFAHTYLYSLYRSLIA